MSNEIDGRMQWILLFEENSKNTTRKQYFIDYEVCSEVRIPGVFNYSDGNLLCALFSEKDEKGLYTYTIRIKYTQKGFSFDENKFALKGYYFKNDVIGELLAIFSFYFQARFFLKSIISGDLTPFSIRHKEMKQFKYIKPSPTCNFEMFSDQNRNWANKNGLNNFLDKLKHVNSLYHQSIIQSFHWYFEAIKEIGADTEHFYLKMVSCVESLISFVKITSNKLEEKLTAIAKKDRFTDREKLDIKNWLGNRKIKRRFVKFIKHYSQKGFFKSGYRKAKHCYITKDNLDNYLNRIYDSRSAYIHTGKPMYISSDLQFREDIPHSKFYSVDLDPVLRVYSDRRMISGKGKLPTPRWFERIVNYCIKKFIEELLK